MMPESPAKTYSVKMTAVEINAAIKHHLAATRRISKAYGQAALELRTSIFPKKREFDALTDLAKKQMDLHSSRIRVLAAAIGVDTNPKKPK